jgi:hypothetical protein
MPFMSVRLLGALHAKEPTIHTALDDLESFLWLLMWGIVYASKKINGATTANRGINFMLDAWSSSNPKSNLTKITGAEDFWKDAVFGDLIQQWLDTFRKARKFNTEITEEMSFLSLGTGEWDGVCRELESYCNSIYKEILESGFKHLGSVSEYPTWDRVVAANSRKTIRKRYNEVEGA